MGASRSSKPRSAELGRDLGADAEGCERLVDDQQPAGLGDRMADGSISSGATVRGSISSTEMPSAARLLAGFQRLMHHQRQGDDGDVACPRARRRPGRSRFRNRPRARVP